ncbi:solute carrier family 25 member 36-A-like [Ambystoma mexicanum]|uniref:solute carrier family 25 member 36-A-like n=1 Tax=Ambystoma mexicanum TaxID=8296 RepID=UPI0037E7BBF8
MPHQSVLLHLVAGGCGGTVGAIVTCPLEVVKTRLQASPLSLRTICFREVNLHAVNGGSFSRPARVSATGVLEVLRNILQKEGHRSLFRGLGPTVIGVAPTRAIYFGAYSCAKEICNSHLEPETKAVHMLSASFAGFVSITMTNPIWLVKTRLQLDESRGRQRQTSTLHCVRNIFQTEGMRGFYRGMSASYVGISETVIKFVIYEELKQRLNGRGQGLTPPLQSLAGIAPQQQQINFLALMLAAGVSKTCASIIAYPHEVIRTRLRQKGSRYKTLVQTTRLVYQQEGLRAFYRGLQAQMIRQIPNTAIMMTTYELIVHIAGKV